MNIQGANAAAARVNVQPQPMLPLNAALSLKMHGRGDVHFKVQLDVAWHMVITSYNVVDTRVRVFEMAKEMLAGPNVWFSDYVQVVVTEGASVVTEALVQQPTGATNFTALKGVQLLAKCSPNE